MKTIVLFLNLIVAVMTVAAQDQIASRNADEATLVKNYPSFSWTETSYDFGKVASGSPVTHEFTFINNGTVPMLISGVQASCGCTVAEFSKDPIAPGASGFVKATYNASRIGVFTKSITVNANTETGVVRLQIKGEVIE